MKSIRAGCRNVLARGSLALTAFTALAAAGGCSSADAAGAATGASVPGDAGGEAFAGVWEELVAGDWELPPGDEGYRCVRLTLKEDVVIGAVKPIGPPGTHHTTLTLGAPTEPDGIAPCAAFAGATGEMGIWASAVNTPPTEFPPKVGMVLKAGKQLLLNLHLFNASQEPLRGRSGIAFRRRLASSVEHEAEGSLMGPVGLTLPDARTTHVVGGCTFREPGTIFAVLPHMHRLGRHMKIVAEIADEGERVLHDADFDFQEQVTVPVPEVTLGAGDRLRVECTYDNDSGREVGFGESTRDEMCFSATARYPARGEPVCFQ